MSLTDTSEDSKPVHRRKRPKVDTLFSSLVFPTRPSKEYDSAPSRKYSRPLLDVFSCIGYSIKMIRAIPSKAESITSASSSTVILLGTDFLGTSGDSLPQGSKIKHKIFQTKKRLRLIFDFCY